MIDLLTDYSLSDILIFMVVLALAFKSLVSFFDWFWDRIRKITDKEYKSKQDRNNLENEVHELEKFYDERKRVDEGFERSDRQYQELKGQIDLLIKADIVNMRSQITDKYHQFENLGWIDDRSLMCLEDIYEVYKAEGGNHFVETLMEELRSLPKSPKE